MASFVDLASGSTNRTQRNFATVEPTVGIENERLEGFYSRELVPLLQKSRVTLAVVVVGSLTHRPTSKRVVVAWGEKQ